MTVDSTATDREVWQVMSGAAEPRYDATIAATTADNQAAAGNQIRRNPSWADCPAEEPWSAASASTGGTRLWGAGGQGRLETDDASIFGAECSLSSMMRSIASEADGSYPWGASAPKPTGPAQDVGNRWNGLPASDAGRDQSSFGPFVSDGWGCLVGSVADTSKAVPRWDVENKSDVAEPHQSSAGERTDTAGKWLPLKSELPTEAQHSRAGSIAVAPQEPSVAADAGSNTGSNQPATSVRSSSGNDTNAIIQKLINSNDGWGKRPVRQDVPWVMEDFSEPSAAAAGDIVENTNKDVARNITTVAPVPDVAPSAALYWGDVPSRPAAAVGVDFGTDSDIGMWSGPPEGAGAGQLLGMPKDGSWHGLASLGAANPSGGMPGQPQPLGSMPTLGLASHLLETGSFPGVPPSFIDVMQRELAAGAKDGLQHGAADAGWPQMLGSQRQNSTVDSGLGSVPVTPMDGGSAVWRSPTKDQVSPPSGMPKIGSWNELPGSASGMPNQTFWNQPPPMSSFPNQMQQLQGSVRDDMMQFTQPQQRGRMLRGQNTGDVIASGGMVYQDPSGRSSAFQPVFNSAVPPPLHRKQQSAGGGAGWPGGVGGGTFPPYGATAPHMNQASLQRLLELQAVLQPLLNERSNVQQSRTMSAQQRRQTLDRLNPMIDAIRRQMDQLQIASASHPSELPPGDVTAQLLGRLALDHDPYKQQFPPMGDLGLRGGIGSPGTDIFGGGAAWMGGAAAAGSQYGWSEPGLDTAAYGRGLRGPAIPGGQMPPHFSGNSAGRSSLWSPPFAAPTPATKVEPAAGKNGGQNWLKLSNISSQLDGGLVQILCSQYGNITVFLHNKVTSQALACFTSLDDARRASATLGACAPGAAPLMSADVVSFEAACQLIEGQAAVNWVQLPAAVNAGPQAPPFSKP